MRILRDVARNAAGILLVPALACGATWRPACADALAIASPVTRSGTTVAAYRLDPPVPGDGTLSLEWTDGAGRLVMRQVITVAAPHGDVIAATLDLRRAVVMTNRLAARFVPDDGTAPRGAEAGFIAVPAGTPDWDYPIIIWHDQTPARAAGLRRLGITAGRVLGERGMLTAEEADARMAPWLAADLRFYLENIATDFYAAYHRYQPGRPVTWAFDQAQALHQRDPADPAAFERRPSLSDPQALAAVTARLAHHVRLFGPYRPLFYSLGDETGIADLAAAWDFDLSPVSLAAFRLWLRTQYGSLAALNRQWGTAYADWQHVRPMTTDQAVAAASDTFSAWSDFKAFMDSAFAAALRAGTEAVHADDPTALAGIEGAQVPGWGGYDYAKLAAAVDVMEIYDSGNNVEIAQALNPRLRFLMTAFPDGKTTIAPAAAASIWREMLQGDRGIIIWDNPRLLVDDAGQATALGTAYGALFHELRDGLAQQFGTATTPPPGPVALLYSPASFRVGWLLDRRQERARGAPDWSRRTAEIEDGDNAVRASMRQAAAALTHLGLPPRWISDAALRGGVLRTGGIRVLLLPRTLALSDQEVAEIRDFARRGGTVWADEPPGAFDAHGRRRPALPLDGVAQFAPGWWDAAQGGLQPLAAQLHGAGVTLPFAMAAPDGTVAAGIEARVRQDGPVRLIGLQPDSAMPGDTDEVTVTLTLTLARPQQVYDLRRHRDLGRTDRVTLAIGGADPALLAVAPAPLPPLTLAGPATLCAGTDAVLSIAVQGARLSDGVARTVHVETRDPDGAAVAVYSGNLTLHGAPAVWRVPFALNDRPGTWTIRVADRLTGETPTWPIVLRAGTADCAGTPH